MSVNTISCSVSNPSALEMPRKRESMKAGINDGLSGDHYGIDH